MPTTFPWTSKIIKDALDKALAKDTPILSISS